MPFRIIVIETNPSPESTPPLPLETEIFKQTVADLDIRKFARDINKTPRTRRVATKTPRATT